MSAKGHISVPLPVSFDPIHRVTIGHLGRVDAFALERHFVLLVVASAIGCVGEADEHRDGVSREPGAAVPEGQHGQPVSMFSI